MLTFDEENHEYFWNGKPVPGVTEILRATGQAKDWAQVPSFYRNRGQAVHKAIELWLRGTLDVASLDPVIVPYFEQFKGWAKNAGEGMLTGLLMAESPMYSASFGFAGTVDLIANQTIYDIKCSKKLDRDSEWQYRLQGAAYRTLVKETMGHDFPFNILLLTGTGDVQVIPLHAPYAGWEYVMALYDLKMGRP